MTSPETFGLALRRARQHRGISLEDVALHTKVKVELWEDMEANDFSRWPQGLYARTWIKVYAELVGLDPQKTVDDFCRWFPHGDRRAETTLRKQAEIVGHGLEWQDDLAPPEGDRRTAPAPAAPGRLAIRHLRWIAAAADLSVVVLVVVLVIAILPVRMSSALAVIALAYYTISLGVLGCTPAVWVLDSYAQHDPAFYRGAVRPLRRLRSAGEISTNVVNAGH
jgi:hypothetical protein